MENEKIGINVRRHKEMISRLYEILEEYSSGPNFTTAKLIELIADEPTFTKKDCVYAGLYLATAHTGIKKNDTSK